MECERGSLLEFLLAQGLNREAAFLAKPPFDAWMRRNNKLPKATLRGGGPKTNVYDFSALGASWTEYKTMLAGKGFGAY